MKKKRRLLQSDTFWGAAAVLLVLLQFWWLPGDDGSAADSYSTTVDGKLGLFRTLSELFPSVRREATRAVPENGVTLLIVSPDTYPTSREEEELRQFVYNGGTLLFAPSLDERDVDLSSLSIRLTPIFSRELPDNLPWPPGVSPPTTSALPPQQKKDADADTPEPNKSSGQSLSSTDDQPNAGNLPDPSASSDTDPASSAGQTADAAPDPSLAATPPSGPTAIDDLRTQRVTVTGELASAPFDIAVRSSIVRPPYACQILLGTESDPLAVSWFYGSGQIVVCASPDLFSNRSMLYKPSRRTAVRLVERTATLPPEIASFSAHDSSTIVISEYFNTTDAFRSTGVLFSPMMRIGTLQLLLVAVLGIWLAFHRFGPASETIHVNRRSLQESAEAVGNLQYRLSDGGAAVRSYLDFLRSQLRRRFGSSVRLEDPGSIAGKARLDIDEVTSSLNEATRMANVHKLSANGAANSIRWLSRLQLRLFGNSTENRKTQES